jgi:copper chaperone CopZ
MHCVRAVEAVLNAIPGVRSVEVKVGEAKVVADDSVEEKTLKSAIQEEGYEIA